METPRAFAILVLRLFTMLLCAASVPLMVSNSFELSGGDKTKYSDIKAYRFTSILLLLVYSFIILKIYFLSFYLSAILKINR